MKNILLTSAAVALLAAAQANAAVYEISYSFLQSSTYTASKPLSAGGIPDPTHAVGTGGSPTMAGQGIVAAPILGGTGTLDTVTGQIHLNPIDYEITVVSGSFGYVGWSQTFNGSFSGNVFNMTGATVNGGAKVCEDQTPLSQSCTADGGPGALPLALGTPQFYTPPVVDEEGNVVTPGFSTPSSLVFSSLSTGGTGLYLNESDVAPAFSKTSINITIGNEVSQVPVPAAAWLFGSGLLGLAGIGRKRR